MLHLNHQAVDTEIVVARPTKLSSLPTASPCSYRAGNKHAVLSIVLMVTTREEACRKSSITSVCFFKDFEKAKQESGSTFSISVIITRPAFSLYLSESAIIRHCGLGSNAIAPITG